MLRLIWLEGWAVGHASARAFLADADAAWSWAQGDTDAALRSLPDGMAAEAEAWSRASAGWAQQILDSRQEGLARLLADAFRDGQVPVQLADLIRGFLGDTAWARLLALTELVRAQTAAAAATYRDASIGEVRWVAEGDERTCLQCLGLEAQGPVPIGAGWDGSDGPPAHPRCRCYIAPA